MNIEYRGYNHLGFEGLGFNPRQGQKFVLPEISLCPLSSKLVPSLLGKVTSDKIVFLAWGWFSAHPLALQKPGISTSPLDLHDLCQEFTLTFTSQKNNQVLNIKHKGYIFWQKKKQHLF